MNYNKTKNNQKARGGGRTQQHNMNIQKNAHCHKKKNKK